MSLEFIFEAQQHVEICEPVPVPKLATVAGDHFLVFGLARTLSSSSSFIISRSRILQCIRGRIAEYQTLFTTMLMHSRICGSWLPVQQRYDR